MRASPRGLVSDQRNQGRPRQCHLEGHLNYQMEIVICAFVVPMVRMGYIKKGVGGTHQRCPPQSKSGLVSFFSSFFQPVSFHEKTLISLTSCPRSGMCLAAKASSVEAIMIMKRCKRTKVSVRTISDRHWFVDIHWRCTVNLLV